LLPLLAADAKAVFGLTTKNHQRLPHWVATKLALITRGLVNVTMSIDYDKQDRDHQKEYWTGDHDHPGDISLGCKFLERMKKSPDFMGLFLFPEIIGTTPVRGWRQWRRGAWACAGEVGFAAGDSGVAHGLGHQDCVLASQWPCS